jgi:hypothetical protein
MCCDSSNQGGKLIGPLLIGCWLHSRVARDGSMFNTSYDIRLGTITLVLARSRWWRAFSRQSRHESESDRSVAGGMISDL